jgi:hypothetical protein
MKFTEAGRLHNSQADAVHHSRHSQARFMSTSLLCSPKTFQPAAAKEVQLPCLTCHMEHCLKLRAPSAAVNAVLPTLAAERW